MHMQDHAWILLGESVNDCREDRSGKRCPASNPQLATAFPGLNAPRLATQVAGIDRNQAATAITVSGLFQNGACLNIKGVVMPNGGKVYYLPESYYYESATVDKTKGDQYFCTAAEALTAGFTPGK